MSNFDPEPPKAPEPTVLRTFSCFTYEDGYRAPAPAFIVAEDETRARLLVRRELLNNMQVTWVEVYEDGTLLWTEWA